MVWDKPELTARHELSPVDKTIVGRSHCRLHIPLGEPRMMTLVNDEVRRLLFAIEVEMLSPGDKTLRGRLLRVRQLIMRTNEDIRLIAEQFDVKVKEGRPKSAERGANGSETVKNVLPAKSQRIVAG